MQDVTAIPVEQAFDVQNILVTGDTHYDSRHNRLPAEIIRAAERCDLIVHLGDFCNYETLDMFHQLGRVIAVAGNNDDPRLGEMLPLSRILEINEQRIVMMHGHGVRRLSARKGVEHLFGDEFDMVLFGHSHKSLIEQVGDSMYVNPGSPTNKRWQPEYSFATVKVGDTLVPRLHYFDRPTFS